MESKTAAGLIVYRVHQNLEFLLVRDALGQRRHWTPPKGFYGCHSYVLNSEDPLKTALREVQEQTGLSARDLHLHNDFTKTIKYLSDSRPKSVKYYLAQMEDHARVVLTSDNWHYGWFEPAHAVERVLYPNMQDVLRAAGEYVEQIVRHQEEEAARQREKERLERERVERQREAERVTRERQRDAERERQRRAAEAAADRSGRDSRDPRAPGTSAPPPPSDPPVALGPDGRPVYGGSRTPWSADRDRVKGRLGSTDDTSARADGVPSEYATTGAKRPGDGAFDAGRRGERDALAPFDRQGPSFGAEAERPPTMQRAANVHNNFGRASEPFRSRPDGSGYAPPHHEGRGATYEANRRSDANYPQDQPTDGERYGFRPPAMPYGSGRDQSVRPRPPSAALEGPPPALGPQRGGGYGARPPKTPGDNVRRSTPWDLPSDSAPRDRRLGSSVDASEESDPRFTSTGEPVRSSNAYRPPAMKQRETSGADGDAIATKAFSAEGLKAALPSTVPPSADPAQPGNVRSVAADRERPSKRQEPVAYVVEKISNTATAGVAQSASLAVPGSLDKSAVNRQYKGSLDETLEKELRAFFSGSVPLIEQVREVQRREVKHDLTKQQLFNILIPSLFHDDNISAAIERHKPLLKKFVLSPSDQMAVLRSWERYYARSEETLHSQALQIIKRLYELDLVEDDAFLQWDDPAVPSAFKTRVRPFLNWLREDEDS